MASPSTTESTEQEPYRVLSGYCPDAQCNAKLYFPAYDSSIECSNCGKRHEQKALKDVEQVTNPGVALTNILKSLLSYTKPRKGTDSVRVMGLCNYQCKLLSPLLSSYGMDRHTGQAKLLSDMGQGDSFDCSVLGQRAFLIDPEHTEVIGYGRERTGSMHYLKETLTAINGSGEERILPIHADGDGHCLVHAVSRALIGRELFWHPLRENLKRHFVMNLARYRQLFREFIDVSEWQMIIDECDPEFVPLEDESLGMRNIHIFGLANVLRRPIILLDSLSGIQSLADYTGVFLPGLLSPDMCRGKDGQLNKPICLAWSSYGRNHYIALVGVKGRPLPVLPSWMMPKVWGMSQDLLSKYIETRPDGGCVIGGEKCLQNSYIVRLANAMEEVFMSQHAVSTSLVADVYQYVYKTTGFVGSIKPSLVVEVTQRAVTEARLYRCLLCDAITEWTYIADWLVPGGSLYNLAVKTHSRLQPNKLYSFPTQDLVCAYDSEKDELVVDTTRSKPAQCRWCQGSLMRRLSGDGSIEYLNGDCTKTRTTISRCQCGFKHFYNGHEYDNMPERIPVPMEWNGKVVKEEVEWFQYESDPALNSNVYDIAQTLVLTHFPGEFGSERLVQSVVDTILRETANKTDVSPPPTPHPAKAPSVSDDVTDTSWRSDMSSKIILTGQQSKSVHKEELTMSDAERTIQRDIQANARLMQKRRTSDQVHAGKGGSGINDKTPSKPHCKIVVPVESKSPPRKTSPSFEKSIAAKMAMSSSPGTSGMSTSSQAPVASPVEPSLKKVRVSTSDGRQLMLTLEPNITYSGLQTELTKQLDIPSDNIRIKYGFPPRELKPPSDGCNDAPLGIQNGDKVTVEIMTADKTNATRVPEFLWPVSQQPSLQSQGSWTGFESNSKDMSAQNLLQELAHLHDTATDGLDSAINSLVLMCTLMGKDVWMYVQGMPHLFSVGGLFYEQVKRDLGLTDAKHCRLPVLPSKVFAYNGNDDRLELCLEPHGHYAMEPNIEQKVLKSASLPKGHLVSSSGDQAVGGGKAFGKKCQQSHVPFSGQGHSMLSSNDNISMPHDLDMAPHGHKVSKLSHFSGSMPHPASIQEEEDEQSAATAMDMEPTFKRVGPGCTVLDTDAGGGTLHNNANPDTFRTLASQIREIVARTETDLFEQEEEGATAEERSVDTSGTEAGCIPVESQEPGTSDDKATTPTTSHTEPMDST